MPYRLGGVVGGAGGVPAPKGMGSIMVCWEQHLGHVRGVQGRWGKGRHQGRLRRNKCGKIEGKGDKMCKQVVVSGNALCLIPTGVGVLGAGCVYVSVCARVCRSEYQQPDWSGGPAVPMPQCRQQGRLGCRGCYRSYAYIYIYLHIFH